MARRSRRHLPRSMHKTWFHHWLRSSSPLQDHGHGLMIVTLHLEIGHPAVPLGGFDPGMSQKILDGHQGRVGIKELRGHGVPELMARHFESRLAGVMLQAFLDPSYGDGFASAP